MHPRSTPQPLPLNLLLCGASARILTSPATCRHAAPADTTPPSEHASRRPGRPSRRACLTLGAGEGNARAKQGRHPRAPKNRCSTADSTRRPARGRRSPTNSVRGVYLRRRSPLLPGRLLALCGHSPRPPPAHPPSVRYRRRRLPHRQRTTTPSRPPTTATALSEPRRLRMHPSAHGTRFRRAGTAFRCDSRRRPGNDSPRTPSQLLRRQQSAPRYQAHHEPRRTPSPRGRPRSYGADAEAQQYGSRLDSVISCRCTPGG